MKNIHFDRYCFKKGDTLPSHVDFRGSIAITRDRRVKGFVHQMIYLAQKIYNWLFKKNHDPYMAHGMIIVGTNKNDFLISHATINTRTKIAKAAYLNPKCPKTKDVTELIVYVPKNSLLREQIGKYGEQCSFNSHTPERGCKSKEGCRFSIPDMLASISTKPTLHVSKCSIRRACLAAADLLQGRALKDRKNRSRSLDCIGFAALITQASLILHTLSDKKKRNLKKRKRLDIANYLTKQALNKSSELAQVITKNPFLRLNARFTTSSFAASILDAQSEFMPK